MSLWEKLKEKLNPAQIQIVESQGEDHSSSGKTFKYTRAYQEVDCVRRAIDMVVNGAATFDYMIGEQLQNVNPVAKNMRKKKVDALVNYQPNPYQSINTFRRLCVVDYIIDGNIFMYFDGAHLYHLPASNITIKADDKTLVHSYAFNGIENKFTADEVIHIQDNAGHTIYRGESRLKSCERSLQILDNMTKFQLNFFENGAVPGLVLTSPNVLGDKIKERTINSWVSKYNPKTGGKRPLILDGGLDVKDLSQSSFKELDFETSITKRTEDILTAIGVPPILLFGGNNANIAPNLKLFYLETVLPIANAMSSGFERFFGYDLEPETGKISALQPQMSDAGNFFGGLVNGGIITPNEARKELRWDEMLEDPEMGKIRIPQNIAGSASDPSQGGRPSEPKEGKQ